jgi:hypothetical protein
MLLGQFHSRCLAVRVSNNEVAFKLTYKNHNDNNNDNNNLILYYLCVQSIAMTT